MKRLLPAVLSGALALSFSSIAFSQGVGVQGPAGTGATVDLNNPKLPDANVQNNQQVGDQNQSNQQQGDRNQAQNTQQSGDQNQNAQTGSGSTRQKQESDRGKY